VPGFVKCPVCGLDNDIDMLMLYRMCSRCGAQMLVGGPIAPAAPPMAGQAQTVAPPPTPYPYGTPPPPQGSPPTYAPPPYGPCVYPGQPYPSQPYPYPHYPPRFPPPHPPPYGVPYYVPWPPTFHPGVYERPEEPSRLDLGGLFKVLFKPKEAFEDLYHHTAPVHGIALAIIFIVLFSLFSYAIIAAAVSGITIPSLANTNLVLPRTARTIGSMAGGIILNIGIFFIATSLVYSMLKSAGNARRPDFDKTIGLIGYAKFPAFLMYISLYFVMGLILRFFNWEQISNGMNPNGGPSPLCGIWAVQLILVIVTFVWGLWVHSHAAAVANDVAFGTAAGFTLLAWFIALIINLIMATIIGADFF
jgi:hypothetical protein